MRPLKEFIEHVVNEELKTRPDGLTFKVIQDSEGDNNRGWRVDKLEAFLNGSPVGYLKMSYIPEERFNREYPSILSWLGKMQGKGKFNDRYHDLSTPLSRIKAMLDDQDYTGKSSKDPKLNSLDDVGLKTLEKRLLRFYQERYGKEFAKFRNHWVDKPLVDFIRVDKGFQRQGIGIAMYEEGAKYLASMGMRLYASSNQQPAAKAAWDWLRVNAPEHFGIDNGRPFLSFI